MNSIRARFIAVCLAGALLPAIPLAVVVQALLDRSLGAASHEAVGAALESAQSISHLHYELLRERFHDDVIAAVDTLPAYADSARVLKSLVRRRGIGLIAARAPRADTTLTESLRPWAGHPTFVALTRNAGELTRRDTEGSADFTFFESATNAVQFALWHPRRGTGILFFQQTDPQFLLDAARTNEGRAFFEDVKLTRGARTRGFFIPFMAIYAIAAALAFLFALRIAERTTAPIRRLAQGAGAVAAGDWSATVDTDGDNTDETAQLAAAFNDMVARLDAQLERRVDVEKMHTWREVSRHLAHEIKTPLLPIRLTVDEVRDQYSGSDENFRELLTESTRVVAEELDGLHNLVREFSAFARMPEPDMQIASLGQLVREVADAYPQVETVINEYGNTTFAFDATQIRRVLTNLFDNSAGMTPEDVPPRVSIELSRLADAVQLRFKDSGPGIASENLAQVFEPYFTTRSGSAGLGLAMSKNIVLMHGGTITVDTKLGYGTTFVVTLPTGD